MIDKKILSNITGKDILTAKRSLNMYCMTHVEDEWTKNNMLNINIHELANMCKEKAFSEYNDTITSCKIFDGGRATWYSTTTKYYDGAMDGFYANSEPEVIFKAFKWVIES